MTQSSAVDLNLSQTKGGQVVHCTVAPSPMACQNSTRQAKTLYCVACQVTENSAYCIMYENANDGL